jgi:hypothetical protein
MSIKDRILEVKKDIPKNITIVAATKTQSIDNIKQAIKAGLVIIGENYVQEAESKQKELKSKVKIHCIGHLQTNKVKKAVEIFDMIQTVDSKKIAKEINKRTKKLMPILIEVNIGEEPNKDGCMPKDVKVLVEMISKLKNLKLKGLMTMAPYFRDPEKSRKYFKKTKKLFDELKKSYKDIDTLSMGMSDSYKVAIEEGATMIRLGTVIFGKRN